MSLISHLRPDDREGTLKEHLNTFEQMDFNGPPVVLDGDRSTSDDDTEDSMGPNLV